MCIRDRRYTAEAIKQRISNARNGMKEFYAPTLDYNFWLKKYEPVKLKGFKALYYHYLYLFGRIRKRETPQRVSFYMRDELIKFERYQKQFRFLYDNDLETTEQLQNRKISAQAEIEELISKRKTIYGNPEKDNERSKINKRLEKLRKDVRMCKNIEVDSKRISERYKRALELEEDSKRENENKRKGIAYMTKNR